MGGFGDLKQCTVRIHSRIFVYKGGIVCQWKALTQTPAVWVGGKKRKIGSSIYVCKEPDNYNNGVFLESSDSTWSLLKQAVLYWHNCGKGNYCTMTPLRHQLSLQGQSSLGNLSAFSLKKKKILTLIKISSPCPLDNENMIISIKIFELGRIFLEHLTLEE